MNPHPHNIRERRVQVFRHPIYSGLDQSEVYISMYTADGKTLAEKHTKTLVEVEPTSLTVAEPSFMLMDEDAQQLIDELWKVGFRPTAGHGSAGQLAATERHLDDMRTLAFHACGLQAIDIKR